MPVNTSSTGASYGKSSDPLCPLGFHPQVRWPTRCKRCFRDYKEHSDASDRKKYGDLESNTRDWSNTNLRTGFTKSKSLDVSSELPEWRKRMLERQEQREQLLRPEDDPFKILSRSQSVQPEKYSRSPSRGAEEPVKKAPSPPPVVKETAGSTGEAASPPTTSSPSSSWSSNTANSWMSWKTKASPSGETSVSTPAVTPKAPEPHRRQDPPQRAVVPDPPEVVAVKKTPSWKRVDKPPLSKAKSDLGTSSSISVKKETSPKKVIPSWSKSLKAKTEASPAAATSPKVTFHHSLDVSPSSPPGSPEIVSRNEKKSFSNSHSDFESHKANKISEELLKAKARIREYENTVSSFEKDKKSHMFKIRDLEEQLEKRPGQSETKKIISELKTKYDFIDKKCQRLEKENDNLLNNVQNLEGELEEVQDNFREDEADEYRHIKRELELASKNCRVLQFKLKKVEKFNYDLEKEKTNLESKMKALSSGGGSSNDSSSRLSLLEAELEEKKALIKRLEAGKVTRRHNGPPHLSRAGSTEVNIEEQLMKDLKDSIERENDLKEQLSMAEEDSAQVRRQLSQVEDENESLSSQVKRLSTKAYGPGKGRPDDINLGEIRVQLEVSEQENSSLRRKVENLLTENLKLGKQVKESGKPSASGGRKESESLQRELNESRIQLMAREKEINELRGRESENAKLTNKVNSLTSELEAAKSARTSDYAKRRSEEEASSLKSQLEKAKERANDFERRLNASKDKSDQTQREVIAAEREKRRIEEEKNRALSNISKMETEVKDLKREIRDLRSDSDIAKRKNRDNLLQTQEGVKVFKEQISNLKSELSEERNKVRDVRELFEGKISQLEEEMEKLSKSKDESAKKIKDLEDKWAKSKRINVQRKDKIDSLEKQLEGLKGSTPKRESLKTSSVEFQELKTKYDLMEEQLVLAKACLQTEKDDLEKDHNRLTVEMRDLKSELRALQSSSKAKEESWARERRELNRVSSSSSAAAANTSNGWEVERDRFKHIIEDRDSQISQLKIEAEMGRSQVNSLKKEADDLKFKLNDYEKMSKFQKVVSVDDSVSVELRSQVDALKQKMSSESREHKTELNTVIMKYDTKLDILEEEISSLKASCSKYRRERESYKGMLESLQKRSSSGRSSIDGEMGEYKAKANDLSVQVQILEDELSEAKLDASKSNAKIISNKSSYEIQVAELLSRINELEESSLIDSGRARIAGTRTKMELAWQKERDGMKKLINELNTMARDLKSTLLELEKEKDSERLESKRKIEGMRKAFEGENEDTKKQITDLQYDLLELRDAHAKLRTTNEKLRRDRCKIEKENDHFKTMLKEKTKSEIGDDKKLEVLTKDLEVFLSNAPHLLKGPTSGSASKSNLDNEIARTELTSALARIRDSARELSKMNERRTPRPDDGHHRRSSSTRLRSLPIPEGGEDGPDSTRGSRESISSNVSIPLPIPVRTRSVLSESGGMGRDYSIRRLERETSMDRMSSGSRDSSFSTQSEWIRGDKSSSKSKKTSLIGKLKKLTKSRSDDPYGSGSDISLGGSALSINSSRSVFVKAQEGKNSSSSAAGGSKSRRSTPTDANLPYDKYFSGGRSGSSSGGGSLRRHL